MEYELNTPYVEQRDDVTYKIILKNSGTWVRWLVFKEGFLMARSNQSFLRAEDAYLDAVSAIDSGLNRALRGSSLR